VAEDGLEKVAVEDAERQAVPDGDRDPMKVGEERVEGLMDIDGEDEVQSVIAMHGVEVVEAVFEGDSVAVGQLEGEVVEVAESRLDRVGRTETEELMEDNSDVERVTVAHVVIFEEGVVVLVDTADNE